MRLPVIADTIRTAVQGIGTNSHKWENVLHFRKSGALSYTGAIAILDPLLLAQYTVNTGAGTAWKNLAPTTATLSQFVYTPLDGATASTVITHAVPGVSGGDPLPVSTSLVVTLRTALRGRSFRGRVYTGPYDESANTAGAPLAAVVAAIAAQWDRFITVNLAGSGVSLVVASYHLVLATDCLHATVDGRWDTQRRRLNS
jgi:hypothetical protein